MAERTKLDFGSNAKASQDGADVLDGHAFAPQTIVANTYKVVEERAATPHVGVKTGIARLDNDLLPFRPGELIGVLAYTSNGKSSFMNVVARNHARLIKERGDAGKNIVIGYTTEQSIEEQGAVDMAQIAKIDVSRMMRGELSAAEWRELRRAGVQRGTLPWWMIGHSQLQRNRRPHLMMSELTAVIERIIDTQKVTPELIVLDYLQRIPGEPGVRDRRERFVDIVDRAKDLALIFSCPVVLGCQAGRQVKERRWQLPQPEDAQETSNFEQSVDKMISLWLPKTVLPVGAPVPYGEREFITTQNLMLCGLMKQRFGIASTIYDLFFIPGVNRIYSDANEAREMEQQVAEAGR